VRRKAALIIAALALVGVAGGIVASAASLSVTGAGTHADAGIRCTDGPVATTVGSTGSGNWYTSVNLNDLAAACSGQTVTVTVFDASGASIATGTGTAGTAPQSVTTSGYNPANVAGIALLVGGWGVPTTWTPPATVPAVSCVAINNGGNPTGGTCTVTITSTSYWIGYPGAWGVGDPYEYVYVNFSVSTNQKRWEVTFHLDDTGTFPGTGFTPTYVGDGYNVIAAPGYSCAALPTFVAWKGAGNVNGQNNGVLYYTNDPSNTQGTTQICP